MSIQSSQGLLLKSNHATWSTVSVMIIIVFVCLLTNPLAGGAAGEGVGQNTPGETLEGRVLQVREESMPVGVDGQEQIVQQVRVEITAGERRGHVIEITHGDLLALTESRKVEEGDRVLIEHSVGPTGDSFYISDFVRLPALVLLALLFSAAIILVGQRVGLRSLTSMAYSLAIIALYILPRILAGQDPVQVSITGAILATAPSVYLSYGWSWKTHCALLGLAISLLATVLLARLFVEWSHLTGLASEEASLLLLLGHAQVDLRGLALGGIIIGTLGVLDDVTIGQASTTFELQRANPTLRWRRLFGHAMAVGRDHIAATVNTLMLAYVAAALPLFLLLMSSGAPLIQTLNRELLAEEIIRTLAGSLGLILAVPITSVIASLAAPRYGRKAQEQEAAQPA
jgi:uncharacterized membrane protein